MNSTSTWTATNSPLHLPRILCLHGGGTNAQIFRAQCRRLIAHLKSEYRLVFAQGPFPSHAGSDVLSVYSQWGPFRRWLRWRQDDPIIPPEDSVMEIDRCLEEAMDQDDMAGGTGEWVALLGFSQGAKLAASVLYRQQLRDEMGAADGGGMNFRFGILLAGRAPLVSLDLDFTKDSSLPDASQITDFPSVSGYFSSRGNHILRLPTLHVHGTRDKGIALHRHLFQDFCDPHSRRLVEWDGDHRVPLKTKDVLLVVQQIRELTSETAQFL